MPDLAPGQRVRIRASMPPGHVRTPAYLRGRTGVIERALGAFPDPERLAYGQHADLRPLFRVRFRMGELWEAADHPDDTLDAEVFDHWIEAPLNDTGPA